MSLALLVRVNENVNGVTAIFDAIYRAGIAHKMEKLEVSFTTNVEAFVIYALAALASLPKLYLSPNSPVFL